MEVYQCPCCELRFVVANELLAHVGSDHPNLKMDTSTAKHALLGTHLHRHAAQYEAGADRNSP